MSRKKTLEDKIADLELGLNDWLEPLREWLKGAQEELSCLLVRKKFLPRTSLPKSSI